MITDAYPGAGTSGLSLRNATRSRDDRSIKNESFTTMADPNPYLKHPSKTRLSHHHKFDPDPVPGPIDQEPLSLQCK